MDYERFRGLSVTEKRRELLWEPPALVLCVSAGLDSTQSQKVPLRHRGGVPGLPTGPPMSSVRHFPDIFRAKYPPQYG